VALISPRASVMMVVGGLVPNFSYIDIS
jgi:hypothetical protein